MALAWALRDDRMTSLVLGASSVAQLEQNLGALANLEFTDTDLAAIDVHAVDTGIDLWSPFRLGATNSTGPLPRRPETLGPARHRA
jgi:L-glyceraldehyde 3-phosphate reductase